MDPQMLAALMQMLQQQQQMGQPQVPNAQMGMPQPPRPQMGPTPTPQAPPVPQAMQAAPPPPPQAPGAAQQMGQAALTNAPTAAANPWLYLASIIMPTLLQSMFGQKQQFSAPAQVIPSPR